LPCSRNSRISSRLLHRETLRSGESDVIVAVNIAVATLPAHGELATVDCTAFASMMEWRAPFGPSHRQREA
jgi:hypothetical protein